MTKQGMLCTWYRAARIPLLVNVDRLDRIALLGQGMDRGVHSAAGTAPIGPEIE